MSWRVPLCLAIAAVLVACGGGGGFSTRPVVSATGSSAGSTTATVTNGTVSQPFAISVARASAVTRVGIASSAESGSPEHDVAIGAGVAGCSAGATSQLCAFTLALPWGPQTLTVTTYGLKVVQTKLKVGLSGTRIALATGVTVAQVSLDLADTVLATNQAATTSLYVTARDANGNIIIGDFGGTTVTVADSDTSGATSLSATTVSNSAESPLTVSYTGAATTGQGITFTATAPGVATSAITSATLSFTAPQVMYVGNQANVEVFARNATLGDQLPLSRFSLSGYYPAKAVPDGHGNLFLLAFVAGPTPLPQTGIPYNDVVLEVPAGSTGLTSPTVLNLTIPSGQTSIDIGVDGSGNLYVLSTDFFQDGGTAISVFAPGTTTPSRVIAGAATLMGSGSDNGMAVSSTGAVAINESSSQVTSFPPPAGTPASIYIFGPTASGNVAPSRVIAGSATGLTSFGILLGETYPAWFPDGELAVSDIDTTLIGSVKVFAAGANGNVAPIRNITGGATGLTLTTIPSNILPSEPPLGTHRFAFNGLAVDNASRIYVSAWGSSAGLRAEILRFDSTANGNAVPSSVLGGTLTGLEAPGSLTFANAVINPAPQPSPSVSGDFLALAANRGWNYTVTPGNIQNETPSPPVTITLYDDPQPQGSDSVLVLLETPQLAADATSGQIASYGSFNGGTGGYIATGYYNVANYAGGPIPGGIQLVPGTLTKGQTWIPYPGLTATVIDVGTNITGSGACPGGGTPLGATVQYTFGYDNERISYVPGCGITHMVTDNGTQVVLNSVGSYPTLGQLAHDRQPASLRAVEAIRGALKSMFTPWSPR